MNCLLLGGTSEARQLASVLANKPGIQTTFSLAGVIRRPPDIALPIRVGGFGGVAGLTDHLHEHAIDVVIDATHPFASQMSTHAAHACHAANCNIWRLERPAWQPAEGDHWISASDLADAAARLADFGPRVFLSVGARSLSPFESVPDKHWIVRSIQAPEPPPAFAESTQIVARPPFSLEDEIALLRDHAVDVLVTKNSGAPATTAKLHAARQLAIPVVMVERPALPAPDRLFTAIDAIPEALANHSARHSACG